jgi:hypothetical protein
MRLTLTLSVFLGTAPTTFAQIQQGLQQGRQQGTVQQGVQQGLQQGLQQGGDGIRRGPQLGAEQNVQPREHQDLQGGAPTVTPGPGHCVFYRYGAFDDLKTITSPSGELLLDDRYQAACAPMGLESALRTSSRR